MGQHTAVGRYDIVSKICSADWQAGFPGIAGNVAIDFIGGNDQRAKDHLSKITNAQLRKFDLSRVSWLNSPTIPSSSLSYRALILPAPYLPAHTSAPVPALLDEFLIQIQTVWQTDILHGARAHIAAVDHAKALRLPLNLHHGAVETGLRFTLIGGNADNTCDVGECGVLGEL